MKTEEQTLSDNERIAELLELLAQNQMEKEAGCVKELCSCVDGLEQQLKELTVEMAGMRKQLQKMQETTFSKRIREQMKATAEHLTEQSHYFREQSVAVKQQIVSEAVYIINASKRKGKQALYKVAEFAGIREKLTKMREDVMIAVQDTDQVLAKMDRFGIGMREAGHSIANAFRSVFDKTEVDYTGKEKRISKTEIAKQPWMAKRKLLSGVEKQLAKVLDSVDALVQATGKDKAPDEQSKDADTGHSGEDKECSVISEGGVSCQYGADAFEAYKEKNGMDAMTESFAESGVIVENKSR